MAKRFKKGDTVYVPVTVDEVEHKDRWYDYVVRTPAVDGVKAEFPFCVKDEEVKTAEEIYASRQMADEIDHIENMLDYGRQECDEIAELKSRNAELEAKLAEFKDTVGKQSDKLKELQARIIELNEVNSSLGENRDALNNEAAVHMTSIHNLQVAVEVLAEKIFEMRCEQDG